MTNSQIKNLIDNGTSDDYGDLDSIDLSEFDYLDNTELSAPIRYNGRTIRCEMIA